ncbi:hypothetical protein ACUC2M_03810 [Bacillus cytotoxicus]
MGFFPYVWLVYLAFPIYSLSQQTGWKLVIGSGMLVVFVLAYRQLYFVKKNIYSMGMLSNVYCVLFRDFFIAPILFFYAFFTANAIAFAPTKRSFRVLFSLLVLTVVAFILTFSQIFSVNSFFKWSTDVYFNAYDAICDA